MSVPRLGSASIARALPPTDGRRSTRETDSVDEGRQTIRSRVVDRMRSEIAPSPVTNATLAKRLEGLGALYGAYRRFVELRGAEAPVHDAFGVGDRGQVDLRVEVAKREAALRADLAVRGVGSVAEFERAIDDYTSSFARIVTVEALAKLGRFERRIDAEIAKAKDAEHVRGLAATLLYLDAPGQLRSAQKIEGLAALQSEPGYSGARERQALYAKAASDRASAERQLDALAVAYPILSLPGIDREAIALAAPERLQGVLIDALEDRKAAAATLREELNPEIALGLDEAVAAAKQDLHIEPGSIHDVVIDDRIRAEADGRACQALAIAGISATLAIASGGTAGLVSVAASGAALGAGVFQAMNEIHAYEIASAAHTTELLTEKPELAWVVVAVAGAGLDAAAAYSALKALRPAAAAFHATRDVARLERHVAEIATVNERLRHNIVRAARAEKDFAAAVDDLLEVTGRMYCIPVPPEALARGARVVFHLLERGVIGFDNFVHGLRLHAIASDLRQVPEDVLRQIYAASEATAKDLDAHGKAIGMSRGQVHSIVRAWAQSPEPQTSDAIRAKMTRWAAPPRLLDEAVETAAAKRVLESVGDLRSFDVGDLETAVHLAADLGPIESTIALRLVSERLAREATEAPIASFIQVAALARRLGGDAESAAMSAIAGRLRTEITAIRSMAPDRQAWAVRQLRAATDAADLDIHVLLRQVGPPPPLDAMSLGARRALREIDAGEDEVVVASRREAEEILAQHPELVDTGDWGWTMIKGLLKKRKSGTHHWDEVFGPEGYILHHAPPNRHAFDRHLHLHVHGRVVRVVFE